MVGSSEEEYPGLLLERLSHTLRGHYSDGVGFEESIFYAGWFSTIFPVLGLNLAWLRVFPTLIPATFAYDQLGW